MVIGYCLFWRRASLSCRRADAWASLLWPSHSRHLLYYVLWSKWSGHIRWKHCEFTPSGTSPVSSHTKPTSFLASFHECWMVFHYTTKKLQQNIKWFILWSSLIDAYMLVESWGRWLILVNFDGLLIILKITSTELRWYLPPNLLPLQNQ